MDFFIDRMVKYCILEQIKAFDKKTQEQIDRDNYAMWKIQTRQMFEKYDANKIFGDVEEACYEASDYEYYEKKLYKKSQTFAVRTENKIVNHEKNKIRKEINSRLKISEVAKQFNLEVDSKGKMLCPFHADGSPSCYINDNKNVFHCFGCGAKGDIIEFYRRLKSNG